MINNSRRWSSSICRPKSTNRWKGRGVIRVVQIWHSQEHFLLALQIRDVRRWGTRIPLGQCGDDGGKSDESDRVFPHSFVFLSPWTCPLSRSSGNTGTSRPARCSSELLLRYESRDPSALALANAGPSPPPRHILSSSLVSPQQLGTAQTGSTNQLCEAGHRHTVESGTATQEVWSLSLTRFYSRSSQPAEFGCGLSHADISHLSCE
jgi:hypothetical protein